MAKKKSIKPKAKTKPGKKTPQSINDFLADNLLYVSMYAFLLIVTLNIYMRMSIQYKTMVSRPPNSVSAPVVLAAVNQQFKTLPQLNEHLTTPFPILSAQAVVALDLDSNLELYEKNPNVPMLPASTVKIVTALVAMDQFPVNKVIEVGDVSVAGQRMRLVPGEKITVESLLHGLLIYSANDAAEVLAQSYPGGRDFFITEMNVKAARIGVENTRLVNPTGLDGVGSKQYTTANDLVRISKYAMNNPYFANIVGKDSVEIRSVDDEVVHKLTSTNKLLTRVDGVLGVKTGWTESARENLVTYVERGGRKVILVLLGSQDRFGETEELIEWIFDNYSWKEVEI